MLRYLGGVALVGVLIGGGVVLRIQQIAGLDERASADAIVVLGAAQYDGAPSPVFRARLDHAAELFEQGVAPRIVAIGGGQSGDRTTEGDAGVDYLAGSGIRPDALIAVGSGDDTLASLRAAEQLLAGSGWSSVVLVTDPWHSARAALMATDLGLSVQLSPVRDGPSTRAGVEARYVVREALGVLYYRLTGGSSGVGSAVL
ncbi:MAG: YdcF family protein [Nakamurella sp.]